MEAKKAMRKSGCVHRPKKVHGPPQCFPLTHRHSDTTLEGDLGGCLKQSRQQAKVSVCILHTILVKVYYSVSTQIESVSREPLPRSAHLPLAPQSPKVRSPFIAPWCRGFLPPLRLLCACFAPLASRASFAPRAALHQCASHRLISRPPVPLQTLWRASRARSSS